MRAEGASRAAAAVAGEELKQTREESYMEPGLAWPDWKTIFLYNPTWVVRFDVGLGTRVYTVVSE